MPPPLLPSTDAGHLQAERESFLGRVAGFSIQEKRFRSRVERLRRLLPDRSASDLRLTQLPRAPDALLVAAAGQLDAAFGRRQHSPLPLCCRQLHVTFEGEPGEGSGVVKGFLAAALEALLSARPPTMPVPSSQRIGLSVLPLDSGGEALLRLVSASQARELALRRGGSTARSAGSSLSESVRASAVEAAVEGLGHEGLVDAIVGQGLGTRVRDEVTKLRRAPKGAAAEEGSSAGPTAGGKRPSEGEGVKGGKVARVEGSADKASGKKEVPAGDGLLFHSPGQPGFVVPVPSGGTTEGNQWFRFVGRLLGLSLLHGHTVPVRLCRHVLKYVLGRAIGFHDLAFCDAQLYEGLRKTIVAVGCAPSFCHRGVRALTSRCPIQATTLRPEQFETWGLSMRIDLPDWLGGGVA